MATVEERLEQLEDQMRAVDRTGLLRDPGRWFPGSLQVVRADANGDGEFEPYKSAAWTLTVPRSTDTGTIHWTNDFGVPDGAKMVFIETIMRDSGAEGQGKLVLYAKSSTSASSFTCRSRASDEWTHKAGFVSVAPDGTSYYDITASGTETCDIVINVVAYAR